MIVTVTIDCLKAIITTFSTKNFLVRTIEKTAMDNRRFIKLNIELFAFPEMTVEFNANN